MLHLPENLKKYRMMKNLTQEDVAVYLGITPQRLRHIKESVTMKQQKKLIGMPCYCIPTSLACF